MQAASTLENLARRYVWWESPEQTLRRPHHLLCQLMQLGTDDGVLRLASLLDLAGTMIKVLLQRVETKDYRDIDAILREGVALSRILGAGRALFGTAFNPLVARKTLAYFEDGDLDPLEPALRDRLVAAASSALDLHPIDLRAARLD